MQEVVAVDSTEPILGWSLARLAQLSPVHIFPYFFCTFEAGWWAWPGCQWGWLGLSRVRKQAEWVWPWPAQVSFDPGSITSGQGWRGCYLTLDKLHFASYLFWICTSCCCCLSHNLHFLICPTSLKHEIHITLWAELSMEVQSTDWSCFLMCGNVSLFNGQIFHIVCTKNIISTWLCIR